MVTLLAMLIALFNPPRKRQAQAYISIESRLKRYVSRTELP